MISGLQPVVTKQKLTVNRRDPRVTTKSMLVQREAIGAFVPDFFTHFAQVSIGTIEMNKGKIVTNIPTGLTLFWHQAKTIRSAAILPASRRFVITLVAIRDV